MSGKVECCGESRRKRGKRRPVTGHKICLGDGEDKEAPYVYPDGRIAESGYRYHEDGKDYFGNAEWHEMTDRELNKYTAGLARSGGYDVPRVPNCYVLGDIVLVDHQRDKVREELQDMVKLATGKYNEEQGTKLEFKKVKKATVGPGAICIRWYITFDVLDPEDDAKPTKVFQAKVDATFEKGVYVVVEVHPKPTAANRKKTGQDKSDDQVQPTKPTAARKTTSRKKKGPNPTARTTTTSRKKKKDQDKAPEPTGAA